MKRSLPVLTAVVLSVCSLCIATKGLAAQNSGSAQPDASTQALPSGTVIDTSLSTALDAKKNKAGDRAETRIVQDIKQNGKVVLKKGTKLTGHVTEVQARTKDQSQSELGIVFDHALVKNGEEVPLSLTIQALAAAPVSPAESAISDDQFGSGGGFSGGDASSGPDGGLLTSGSTLSAPTAPTVSSAGSPATSSAHSSGAVGGLTRSGRLAANSNGVFGLESLSLRTLSTSSASEGSVILSPTKNVHLDSGTQVLLTIANPAP